MPDYPGYVTTATVNLILLKPDILRVLQNCENALR